MKLQKTQVVMKKQEIQTIMKQQEASFNLPLPTPLFKPKTSSY